MDQKTSTLHTKHGLIADALSSDIQGGRYQVGDLLPSEPELSLRFGVSRHTVRAALRSLHDLGLVASQKGVGTRVQETRLVSRYSHGFGSAEELLQYATTTPMRLLDKAEVVVDAAMAAQFGCKAGEHWWRLRTVRKDPSGHAVVAWSEIHIPLAYGAVLKDVPRSRQPVFALIVARFGLTIAEIQQEISSITAVGPDAAKPLGVAPEAPGLQIVRRYLGGDGRVMEVTRTVHPSEVFKYAMRVQLHRGDTGR